MDSPVPPGRFRVHEHEERATENAFVRALTHVLARAPRPVRGRSA
ncbi:hypothetical protein ACFWVF_03065 [Streptomyces sp. NPDC058659]